MWQWSEPVLRERVLPRGWTKIFSSISYDSNETGGEIGAADLPLEKTHQPAILLIVVDRVRIFRTLEFTVDPSS